MSTVVLDHSNPRRRLPGEARTRPAEYRSAHAPQSQPVAKSTAPQQVAACSGATHALNIAAMRAALVVGSVVVAVVMWFAVSGVGQIADAELAMLLRGMAAIKALMAVAAAGLVWWRLGQPLSLGVAAAYVACVWVFCAATVLIWQLAFIMTAAALFHAAGLVGLVIALREGGRMLRFGRQASNPGIEATR